jgi:hypothetical protein
VIIGRSPSWAPHEGIVRSISKRYPQSSYSCVGTVTFYGYRWARMKIFWDNDVCFILLFPMNPKPNNQKLSPKFRICSSTSLCGSLAGVCSHLWVLRSTFFSCSSLTRWSLSFSWMNSLPHSWHFTMTWWCACLACFISSSCLSNFSPHWTVLWCKRFLPKRAKYRRCLRLMRHGR